MRYSSLVIIPAGLYAMDTHVFSKTVPLALVAAMVALVGCSTANVAFRNFPTTTFGEVPLDEGSSIRVVARKGLGKAAETFASALEKELTSSGKLRLAGAGENPDFWFIVDGAASFRVDSPDQVRFNTSYVQIAESDDSGGRDKIVQINKSSRTNARGMSVAIYRANGLSPVHYLELPLWKGALGAQVDTAKEKAVEMDSHLFELAIERVRDVFLTQTKVVSIPIPRDADADLYEAVVTLDKAVVDSDATATSAAIEAIERRAAELLPDSIEAFGEKLGTDEWKGREEEAEAVLSNYYIRALASEVGCLDPKKLKSIHADLLRILELSTMDSLRMACPIALARIEYKLGNL